MSTLEIASIYCRAVSKMSAKMKNSAKTLAYFSSFTISTAYNLVEISKSEEESLENLVLPFNHSDKSSQNMENFEDPWWNWCTVFALCSVLSVIFIFSLLAIITKCFVAIKQKDVIKFSSPVTRQGKN